MIATTGGGNTVSILLGDDNGGFLAHTNYSVGQNPLSIAIGNVIGTTAPDIVVANWNSRSVSVLSGSGNGTFTLAATFTQSGAANSALLGDLNNDGRLDITVANFSTGTVTVVLMPPPDLVPPSGTITINQGATATSSTVVTLGLNASDAACGLTSMAFSNDGSTYNAFEPYATTKTWTLPAGDGPKTVFVRFKDASDNVSDPVSATILFDQTIPTGTITINNGALYTTIPTVTLHLSANDTGSGVKQVLLSDGVLSSGWISYATNIPWTLSNGDGTKTISARFRDGAGNSTAVLTSSIVLDRQAPSTTITPLAAYQNTETFTIVLSGSDATSGVASYDLQVRDVNDAEWTDWRVAQSISAIPFVGEDGYTYAFRARARDRAGNVSNYTAGDLQTTIDTTAPIPERLLINGGAVDTTSATVMLHVGANDAASGVVEMSFSNDGEPWEAWQPYTTTAAWELVAGDGRKTIYGRFRDKARNISPPISDTITLNTQVATDYGLTINTGKLFTNQISVL